MKQTRASHIALWKVRMSHVAGPRDGAPSSELKSRHVGPPEDFTPGVELASFNATREGIEKL